MCRKNQNVQNNRIYDLTDMLRPCHKHSMARKKLHTIGYFVFDGLQALDLFGPLETFQEANEAFADTATRYQNIVISEAGRPVTSSSGVEIVAQKSIRNCPALDTLIIPGGEGARADNFSADVIRWITRKSVRAKRVGSVCTGLFILAQTGLLDGTTVTTHWRHIKEAEARFPELNVSDDALFRRNGKLFTAAGVTAGIDMALALIEEDLGPAAASEIARHLVVFVKRPGDQRQYSAALQRQSTATDEFADLAAWITEHIGEELSSETLASRVGLSERQFRRRFSQVFGETPTRHVEQVRVDAACSWLINETLSIDRIAKDAGFSSADVFRRTFERLRGVTPSDYRKRFKGTTA